MNYSISRLLYSTPRNALLRLALSLLLLAVANPFVLERWLSPKGRFHPITRIKAGLVLFVIIFLIQWVSLSRLKGLFLRIRKLEGSFPVTLRTTYVLLALIIPISSIEFGCYLYSIAKKKTFAGSAMLWNGKPSGHFENDFFVPSEDLGYVQKPLENVLVEEYMGEKVIYSARYETDSYGRRKTPGDFAGRSHFAAFFGCSYMFGYGVNQDETLPAHFGRLSNRYVPINYGVNGYGPNHVLAILQSEKLAHELPHSNGLFVYSYIDDHLRRAIGSMSYVKAVSSTSPYYVVRDGKVQRMGSFESMPLLTRAWYRLFFPTYFRSVFSIDWPLFKTGSDFDLVAQLLREAKEIVSQRFNSSRLLVLLYPGVTTAPEITRRLTKANVEYLDLSKKLSSSEVASRSIAYDGHPASSLNEWVAQQVTDTSQY